MPMNQVLTGVVTIKEIDALLSGATPQFSMQLKARVWGMIEDLPADSEVRMYGLRQMQMLDRLALGTTRGVRSPGAPPAADSGWTSIPSHPLGR